MTFTKIDRQNWEREEYFTHYFSKSPCTYSMTVNIDITYLLEKVKSKQMKFYPVMIYGISTVVNRHQEFRMAINENGDVGYFDKVNPSYTIFNEENERFSDMWSVFEDDFSLFYQGYSDDIKKYGECKSMVAKPCAQCNIFNISCVPWVEFSSFHLNLQNGYNYLLPIFTLGKFHVARFANELCDWAKTFDV